jgi:hypothetical protein
MVWNQYEEASDAHGQMMGIAKLPPVIGPGVCSVAPLSIQDLTHSFPRQLFENSIVSDVRNTYGYPAYLIDRISPTLIFWFMGWGLEVACKLRSIPQAINHLGLGQIGIALVSLHPIIHY